MDAMLRKVVLGSIILGVGKPSYIKLHSGREFKNPTIIQLDMANRFGIKDPCGEGDFIIWFHEVDTVY